eukprot:COSAG02_NODE_45836_length_353_cov_2.220472_1_plen_85_part_10
MVLLIMWYCCTAKPHPEPEPEPEQPLALDLLPNEKLSTLSFNQAHWSAGIPFSHQEGELWHGSDDARLHACSSSGDSWGGPAGGR